MVPLGVEDSQNLVSTAWPSLEVVQDQLSFLSYGGFMGGWAASSVGQYTRESSTIRWIVLDFVLWRIMDMICVRDGEYGGPLLLYNHNLSHCVLLSPLNNFMVSSLYHNREEASLQWGLMASVQVRDNVDC